VVLKADAREPERQGSSPFGCRAPSAGSEVRPRSAGRKTLLAPLLLRWLLILALAAPLRALAEPPFELPKPVELNKLRSAVIETSRGDIYVELYPEEAPWTVANFKYLSDKGYYRGRRFHIYLPDYIIQGGGTMRSGRDDLDYVLPSEFSSIAHEAGIVGMARPPDDINPERSSSPAQFHILLNTVPNMDGSYTVFGRVRRGMDVVQSLRKGDTIRDVRVFVRDRN
jgi:peptidyl-prolyl cis-trans isomerase B (cyclophilin B)